MYDVTSIGNFASLYGRRFITHCTKDMLDSERRNSLT